MKRVSATVAVMVAGLTACDTMNRPINTGGFDPLGPPGSGQGNLLATGPTFTGGQFVNTIMDNTAFFRNRPRGDADAEKLLPRGTSMKVISADDNYVRVELDSGEVGWVPTVMVEPQGSTAVRDDFDVVNPGEFQLYPPTGGYGEMLPPSTPDDPPPGGAIPTVIEPDAAPVPDPDAAPAPDPDAPPVTEPVPPVTTPQELPPSTPPLPPGDEVE